MPRRSASLRRFEESRYGLRLPATETAILLTVHWLNVDSGADFKIALDEVAANCFLPPAQTFNVIADLAERGLIRVDLDTIDVHHAEPAR